MNENETDHHPDEGVADRMVNEAGRRFKEIPKKQDLAGFHVAKLFEGRLDKENYIYALIGGFLLGLVLSYVPLIGWIACLALGVVGVGVLTRRFRDINYSGWYGLLAFVPVINLLAAIYLAITDAVDEGNKYGPKPDVKRGFYHAILNI